MRKRVRRAPGTARRSSRNALRVRAPSGRTRSGPSTSAADRARDPPRPGTCREPCSETPHADGSARWPAVRRRRPQQGARDRQAHPLPDAVRAPRPARVHQPAIRPVRPHLRGQQFRVHLRGTGQEGSPEAGAERYLRLAAEPALRRAYLRGVAVQEVKHSLLGGKRARGGRTPKASQVRNTIFAGWSPSEGMTAPSMKPSG